jgi:hypothetical protein
MPAIPIIALAASAAGTIYGAVEANNAAKKAAQVDQATANYNAKYDEAEAAQLDLDTQQNIRTERAANQVYLSKQAASYASAGVSATSGSALDAQLVNAGRMEQQIQQQWVNSNQKQQQLYSEASVGVLEGNAKAEADRMQGTLALINGGTKLAGLAFTGYQAGVFNFGGSDYAKSDFALSGVGGAN